MADRGGERLPTRRGVAAFTGVLQGASSVGLLLSTFDQMAWFEADMATHNRELL
jgi:hypothetical protein